ncbi:MAG: hypothetical protein BAA02_13485 [Paenibacillaceae bacterium ZCTH02-B3]|nr:MAG: hypothetical protein BAA02_13485 [Paenibacillaceae bacterium ZCTH02-B3]
MIGFVVNPVSGNGKGIRTWKKIERTLRRKKIPYLMHITGKPGDASVFARELAERGDCAAVVAVGGDGTVSETAAGLLAAGARKPLGHIPAGSGNDFSRTMGIPAGKPEALASALTAAMPGSTGAPDSPPAELSAARFGSPGMPSGSTDGPSGNTSAAANAPRRIDVFALRRDAGPDRAGGTSGPSGDGPGIAVCSVGAGFDGKVAFETNRAAHKRWLNRLRLGALAYPLSMLATLVTYKPCPVRVIVDGQAFDYDAVWLVAVANVATYGGGMRICPRARPDDGLADVCVVHRIGRLTFLRYFPRVYSGRHIELPGVSLHRGRRVEIRADRPLFVHADGEYAGETPLEIRVIADALPVLAAAPGPKKPVHGP